MGRSSEPSTSPHFPWWRHITRAAAETPPCLVLKTFSSRLERRGGSSVRCRRPPRAATELFWLLLDLVGDREGDLVLFDARVEDLVAKQRGRLRFEEDAGSLLLDHLVVL